MPLACGCWGCAAGKNDWGALGAAPIADLPFSGVPVPVAGGRSYTAISASQWGSFVCALLANKTLECWGERACLRPPACLGCCILTTPSQSATLPALLHHTYTPCRLGAGDAAS